MALAILVPLVTDTFGLCSITPLSSTEVSGAGKPFRDISLGSYPWKAYRPLLPLTLDLSDIVIKLSFLLLGEGIILVLIHLPETCFLPPGSVFPLPSFSTDQRRNHWRLQAELVVLGELRGFTTLSRPSLAPCQEILRSSYPCSRIQTIPQATAHQRVPMPRLAHTHQRWGQSAAA